MGRVKASSEQMVLAEAPQEDSAALIAVTQLPVIEERLRSVKDAVELAVAEAQSMIATEETVQAVKDKRAELRKQFDALETQRKAVKAQIMAPYDRFNAVYDECVGGPFKAADVALKATVGEFEGQLKAECKSRLEGYFAELCAMEQIDFLSFDQAMAIGGIKITLADCKKNTPRQLQDALASVVSRIAVDMERISRMDDAAEIMAEYKKCFDVGKSLDIINGRKKLIEVEKENAARRKAEQERRAAVVASVEAIATPVPVVEEAPVSIPSERVFPEFRFTVYNCTRTQLIKVREFLKQEGISYGK